MSQGNSPSNLSLIGPHQLEEVFAPFETYLSPSEDIDQLQTWKGNLDRLSAAWRSSRLLMAAIEPQTYQIRYANEAFRQLTQQVGDNDAIASEIGLFDLFPDWGDTEGELLSRQNLLYLVLRDACGWEAEELPFIEEPILVEFPRNADRPRFIEFWLDFSQVRVQRSDDKADEFADVDWQQFRETKNWKSLEERLIPENYRINGYFLLEGCDVTGRESILRLTQLLIDRESILSPEKFQMVNQRLRSMFRVRDTVILCAERDRVQMYVSLGDRDFSPMRYSLESLSGSHFLRAAQANRVWSVPDLCADCKTDCERWLLKEGVRSLLLIPVVIRASDTTSENRQLAGLVGMMSDRPHNFNRRDCKHATELIPAFTCALRQAIQQRVSSIRNIHPSVAWRFLQEAERQSWGLPPEPIVFKDVYPLYGISDIRGSSGERNRAIQADLLEQCQLGLAILDAVCSARQSPLTEQLRLDLLEYIDTLRDRVAVDAEVTATEYLKQNLEIYFDYFGQCSAEAKGAIEAYRKACDNEHHSIYTARADYDLNLNRINTCLRNSWERAQERMQKIIPHYCDMEISDGMDRMIYVGKSIHADFTPYHLRCLRYEQLRAICECARAIFGLKSQYETTLEVTHLVLVQDSPIDIFHDDNTEKLFDVKGTKDIRYEIVKKRIDKAVDRDTQTRITQPGMLTIVYSTDEEWEEYHLYLRYLAREGCVSRDIEMGCVEPLQGVTGLKFARVSVEPVHEG
ncbi:MAG: GAF domain-containing protein [Cyanobacteria bacterium J055]|nr:MAG: GAF domain-containing protein [Cyanobacteria bacterium J055]